MIFLGTHPTLTHVPPNSFPSTITTDAPYEAARFANAMPPEPPPTTTTSAVKLVDSLPAADVENRDDAPKPTLLNNAAALRRTANVGRIRQGGVACCAMKR